MAIEVLAKAIRDNHKVKYASYETKRALYAVDFLRSPLDSMIGLTKILDEYSAIPGYKVNEKKSKIMGLNTEKGLRMKLQALYKISWVQKGTKYLGIKISDNPNELLSNNILSYKSTLRNMLEGWKKLTLSWWGRLALIKMKVLPVLSFLF